MLGEWLHPSCLEFAHLDPHRLLIFLVLVIMPKTPNACPLKHKNCPSCLYASSNPAGTGCLAPDGTAHITLVFILLQIPMKEHTGICHRNSRSWFPAICSLDWWCHDEHERSHTADDDGEEDGGLFVGGPAEVA